MATTQPKGRKRAPSTQPDKPQPIAKFSLAPDRPFMTLDDTQHAFRLTQEFGGIEHHEFTRDSNAYDRLFSSEEPLTGDEEDKMEELLDSLLDRVLVNPEKLRAQCDAAKKRREDAGEEPADPLTGAMKREIVMTFTNARFLMEVIAPQQTNKA